MKLNPDKLKGMPPLPADQIYDLKFVGFQPKFVKGRTDAVNYRGQFEVINNPNYINRKIFDNLNSGAEWIIQDFCHGLGLPLEKLPDGSLTIPGTFNGPEDKPEEWKYVGPLVGRTCKVVLGIESYNGKDNNKIKQYICAVTNCATTFPEIRHSTNLLAKS